MILQNFEQKQMSHKVKEKIKKYWIIGFIVIALVGLFTNLT